MKIDRHKLKKSSSEVPADCKALIDRLTSCGHNKEDFLRELQRIETWTYGKCELFHWIDVLDLCDEVLEMAAAPHPSENGGGGNAACPWGLSCDSPSLNTPMASAVSVSVAARLKELLLWTLHFTTLLIEHSFSRHLYSSMEHLTMLLASSDLDVVLAVLNLLYMFSKRSNFITRLPAEKRTGLLNRLTHLAASWGGKENGFGLAKCCSDDPAHTFPESATTLHFEFYAEAAQPSGSKAAAATQVTVIHIDNVDKRNESPAKIMGQILKEHQVPKEKQMLLFTYLRLAASFSNYGKRLKCVQARLQALSVLIYSNQLTDNIQSLLYSGLLEELVEVLEMKGDHLMEIKAAALKALTSIIHLDRNPNFPKLNTIIDVTGAASYHGFLPVLVRNCIAALTADAKKAAGKSSSAAAVTASFPQPLATALFSFLYHLASYEAGGEALVSCGMLESLLKVIQWPSTELDHITFVTRAVRVIDLITNLDMQSFQTHSGLSCFISRLELEVKHCRQQQPFEIRSGPERKDSLAEAMEQQQAEEEAARVAAGEAMEVDDGQQPSTSAEAIEEDTKEYLTSPIPGLTCLPQRAALLKSMLNFLKKAIQDPAFADSIRHVMDGPLPSSLKHIISNAEYYGPSLFLLATDVVTAYVFQEPSLLSSLQDKGLTDVVLNALLVKDVPATREVLGSLPNVFSALCLNTRGLNAFVACKPFERLFKVLLSPDYLPAMRRRRSSDPLGDTASNLGNAMDELMRHQPSLKQAATGAIIKLLEEVCVLGKDPKFVCWKGAGKPDQAAAAAPVSAAVASTAASGNEGGSSDEEEDEEEEQSSNQAQETSQAEPATPVSPAATGSEKEQVPLVDYIHNVMKFVDAILSNNSTDDHCREFVSQKGLVPLMGILGLPNLPIDFPAHQACQAVAAVSKSILTLAHEPEVLKEGLVHLDQVLDDLKPLHKPLDSPGGSVLLRELVTSPNISEATSNPQATPLLHSMSSAHAYIQMFVHVCRTGQNDIRSVSINHWGSELGLSVLKGLSKLYTSLVWESTVLLALCSEDTLPPGCEFGKADMDKLLPAHIASPATASSSSSSAGPSAPPSGVTLELKGTENEETFSPASGTSADSNSSVTAAMENLSTDPEMLGMEVDGAAASSAAAPAASSAAVSAATTGAPSTSAAVEKKDKANPALHFQIKQIKPLLSGSSRLGRALAELFALLVKLCVGSPLRQRRGQQIPPAPAPPSGPARAVATELTRLLASGLSWEPPPTSPIPRFRLTFFICSVGFTAPMLFDEKKFPYHLMLMKFIYSGGQKAFFDTFYWALSCGGTVKPEEGLEHPDLPEGTGEFLDSWLLLLEKMVNPKTVLESPHTLPAKPSGGFTPFDPMNYLARTHRLAFHAVMKLWGKKPLKNYGARMTESILSILCHILKGEKLIAEKLEKTKSTPGELKPIAGPSGLLPPVNAPPNPLPPFPVDAPPVAQQPQPVEPEVNQEQLQTLMDMGFPRERCQEAILNTQTIDQATDYLLNNPLPPLNPSLPPAPFAPLNPDQPPAAAPAAAAPPAVAAPEGAAGVSAPAEGEQDELMRAIAMSLGENVNVSSEAGGSAKKEDEEEKLEKEDFNPLEKAVIDGFTDQALAGCLKLLDTLPDTVYRVCDLLLAVFARNGDWFKQKVISSLIEEVIASVAELNEKVSSTTQVTLEDLETFSNGLHAAKASARIHLFTLLFEECKILCAEIVDESRAITGMTRLLGSMQRVLKEAKVTVVASGGSASVVETPKWMTPMLLFIDLHEKVLLGMNRRARLAKICSHTWKWFDISSGRWCAYAQANNKLIDDAFWAGETNVKIQNGRRKYSIQFGTMMQANEETGNRRPVMISVRERKPEGSPPDEAMDTVDQEGGAPSMPVIMEKEETKKEEEEIKTTIPILDGLTRDERTDLLKACVALVGVPVDADALNAVLRLCLRLTQDFDQAVLFTELGGVKMLLNLTQASNFSGFTSLTTLLIRHVMEDPQTLRMTLEKVIRSETLNSNSSNTKEFHYLLRMLAPAACRAPELFAEVARDILRVDFSLLSKQRQDQDNEDMRLLMKSLPSKSGANIATSPVLQNVSHSVICDLLNFLVRPDPEEMAEGTESETKTEDSSSTTSTSGPASNRTQAIIRNIMRNSSSGELSVPPTEGVIPGSSSGGASGTSAKKSKETKEGEEAKAKEDEMTKNSKPLLTKSAVCRLLAELVKSYGSCAKLITDHIYEPGVSELVHEPTSALAFLLDELLISKIDKDIGQLVKTLVAALASCNQHSEAQTTLVTEVKSALSRALAWPESPLKHTKVQALTTLVSTMIESCPPSAQAQGNSLSAYKQQQYNMNNMVKIMLKRGMISDLARVAHSLDLSSPNVAATVNAALKPLEILTRIVNQPTAAMSGRNGGSSKAKGSNAEASEASDANAPPAGNSSVGAQAGTNTTNSEATRAQGDETVEADPEATEHDVSTAAESIDPNSESQLQTNDDGNEEFDDMMDQLLERDGTQEPAILSETFDIDEDEDNRHDSQMLTQNESGFETQPMSQDGEDRASETSSDSDDEEASTEENEDEDDAMGEEEEDEENADEEDEDDEDDEDEDEGGSPFDDDENEFQEIQDAIYRLDNDQDDIDLMIQYPDGDPLQQLEGDRRAIHLPLWSDVGGNGGGAGGVDSGVGGAGQAAYVAPSHPLLMGRQGAEAASNRTNRTLQRHRGSGSGIRIHLNSRAGTSNGGNAANAANSPFVPSLQSFLGNPQDLIQHGLRRGTPLLVDFGFAILDHLGLDTDAPEDSGLGSGLGNGRAALSTIPPALVRWNEESRVIDGDSMHDCVTALKHTILEVVEKERDEEIAERKAKKKKQQEEEEAAKKAEEEAKKKAEEEVVAAAAAQAAAPTISISSDSPNAASTPETSAPESLAANTSAPSSTAAATAAETQATSSQPAISQTAAQLAEDLAAVISSRVGNFSGLPPSAMETQEQQQQQQENQPNSEPFFPPPDPTSNASEQLPAALGPLSPSPEEARENDGDVSMTSESEGNRDQARQEGESAAQEGPSGASGASGPSGAEANPQPGSSGTAAASDGTDYSAILGIDVSDLPEGVDPSFLIALPEDMRQEVIDEQRRLQNIRQRAAQHVPPEGVQEVSPEFLAALPPNIQEEVLAQQRIEQQRQAATTSNPEAPVDPGEFLSNLSPSLRQTVLADMEESQMSALPPDFAAEAQTLRRQYDMRNHRALMHDRFFSHVGGPGSGATLSSILRSTVNRIGNQYVISGLSGNGSGGGRYAGGRFSRGAHNYPASLLASTNLRFRGRQLLDNEGLSCLLILLFIDDPKINTTRLHRILKYLCYHAPTRDWVVASLLSILEKSNEGKKTTAVEQQNQSVAIGFETPPAKIRKSTSKSSSLSEGTSTSTPVPPSTSGFRDRTPAWLNISMDAALGFRANVFQVQRVGGKKSSSNISEKANAISIHPGASTIVCRHTLEVLISLAKSFPGHFLPWRDMDKENSANDSAKKTTKKSDNGDIWETLLKLDLQSTSKKGKSVVRSHSNVSNFKSDDDESNNVTFDASPFGQLLSMLACPVIRRSSVLTDKLLRLLSLISVGQPDVMKKSEDTTTTSTPPQDTIKAEHLKLAVEVLTSKSCSEEGLEDVNALLLNLSYGPEPTRDTILMLLLQGAQELGGVVRQNVLDLQMELRKLKDDGTAGGEEEDQDAKKQQGDKGVITDKFTKEQVVLNAPSKVKGGSELQLPSMNALTSKTSSQAFFLRVLKVIIQLREAALLGMKKSKSANAKLKEDAAQASADASVTPPGEEEAAAPPAEEQMEVDAEKKENEQPKKEAEEGTSTEASECLESLSDQLTLDALWNGLSSCLKDLADTPDHHAVLVLQATVEAFFLVHAAATQPEDKKKIQTKETRQEQLAHIQEQLEAPPSLTLTQPKDAQPQADSQSMAQNAVALTKDTQKFLSFAETHRTVLNQILRQSTTHLADGPFSVLVDHTRVLDFDIKRRYFRTELERLDEGMRREDLAVHVRRDNVFEDSFRELHRRTAEEWKNRFYIVFEGEEGQDAGGLLREWYVIISREIFNPMYALFKTSPGDRVTYMIYEQSVTNPNHLDYFKFVGRVIAKAIYDNKLLECYFTRSFYKHILAKAVRFQDMESEDYSFFKGLEFLMENNIEELGYDLTFSTEVREFGITEVRDLIPNGRNVKVTEETKGEYVHRVCQMKMTGAVRKQLSAFLEGFYNIIPRRLISIFNEQELELLLSGLPSIDVDDLKANTEYHKYQANSLQIVWFWRALRSFDQTDKAKFMQFVTGSSKVPLQGFSALEGMNGPQKFQIHRDDRSTDRLPSAHTCFNQLDLPAYETYDKLRTNLLKAVQECSEGFGFA